MTFQFIFLVENAKIKPHFVASCTHQNQKNEVLKLTNSRPVCGRVVAVVWKEIKVKFPEHMKRNPAVRS